MTGVATLTDAQVLTNKTIDAATLSAAVLSDGITEEVGTLTGASNALSMTNGGIQLWTLSANSTLTDSLAAGNSVVLGVTAGAYSITWPTMTWTKVGGSGTAPTLTATGRTWVVIWKVGTTLNGSLLGSA